MFRSLALYCHGSVMVVREDVCGACEPCGAGADVLCSVAYLRADAASLSTQPRVRRRLPVTILITKLLFLK